MKTSEVMSRDIATISASANLAEAATVMRRRNIGFLPVLEEGKVVGVLTDRDIVIRSTCEERSPLSSKVYDVMTPTAIWCYEDEMLTDAAQLLAGHHIRRLLVFDLHKKLVGLLSLDDLAARMSSDRLLGNVLRRVTAAPVSEDDQTFERVGRTRLWRRDKICFRWRQNHWRTPSACTLYIRAKCRSCRSVRSATPVTSPFGIRRE